MKSLKGHFLIAAPSLGDPNFSRSVVYLLEHNAQGAFGLVLTRPGNLQVWDLCQRIFEEPPQSVAAETLKRSKVLVGGPVQTSAVFFLHTLGDCGQDPAPPGVFLGTQIDDLSDVLKRLGASENPRFRMFLGYSGWGEGQLDKEMELGGWLVRPATLAEVFAPDPAALWGGLLRGFGGDYSILGHLPPHPENN